MRSKRKRKQKDNNSLKRKRDTIHCTARLGLTALPFPERNGEPNATLETGEQDSNTLILLPKKKVAAVQKEQAAHKVSKAEQRKLKQLERERQLKAQREQVFATLAEHAISDTDFALLKSSATLGQRETKRQRVARELVMQRAGMLLPADAQLERQRKPVAGASASVAEDVENMGDGVFAGTVQMGKAGMIAPSSDTSMDGGTHNSGDEDHPVSGLQNAAVGSSKCTAEQSSPVREQPAQGLAEVRKVVDEARAALGLPPLGTAGITEKRSSAGKQARSGKSRLVQVARPLEVEEARSQLPIIAMEQEIMEAVLENDVVVLSGETGCGKTTQVPQFLFEAGFGCRDFADRSGLIGITQPRRVAAIASAQRVSAELDAALGSLAGYQVRYDRRLTDTTALKFMTDGILLREVQADFLLTRYSCLIIDEAHERSLNTDLLIGMLSRIVPLRRRMAAEGKGSPLKLIIMSATLRTEDFIGNRKLFPTLPPLVHIPARQYPVTVHFNKKTELHDYVGAAYGKVSQIHRQLPQGGILVFMTGQREVEDLCKRIRTCITKKQVSSPQPEAEMAEETKDAANGGPEAAFGEDAAEVAEALAEAGEGTDTAVDDFDEDYLSEEEETLLLGGEGFSAEQLAAAEKHIEAQQGVDVNRMKAEGAEDPMPVHVLPLYAMLPRAAQARVFSEAPPGHRLIVVATNVAETSLTIPGMRYVVDAGRAKQKLLEEGTGVAKYEVGWISKASAEQRAGRAGRTGPGHCYRLFSSAVYNDVFPQHSPPEILNTALEGVVLVMKAMGIDKIDNFPYPSPPSSQGLKQAQQCLVALGAVDAITDGLTPLGKSMSGLPISPRHARLICQVEQDSKQRAVVLPYAVALAAATSIETPFVHLDSIQAEEKEKADRARQSARAAQAHLRSSNSDALSALCALVAYSGAASPAQFCQSHHLHGRHLAEMAALHKQLKSLLGQRIPDVALHTPLQQKLPPLISAALRKAMACGWADQVARRVRAAEYVANQTTGQPGTRKRRAVRYRCAELDEDVYLHPDSALHRAAPEFVVYTQLVRSAKRPYMAGITEIDAHWLVETASPLCNVSSPLDDPPPQYVSKQDAVLAWHDVTFGKHLWELPRKRVLHPDATTRARVFAAALLDGKVLPCMAGLKDALVAPAAMAARVEAGGQPRVAQLIAVLLSKGIDSRAGLRAAWKRNQGLLKPQLAAWMKKGHAASLLAIWPQLLLESQQSGLKKAHTKATQTS